MQTSFLIELLKEIKINMIKQKEYLIQLDGVVGDSDLGLTMSDGFSAAYQAVSDVAETDAGKILYLAGKTMSTAVPSTMGTLMASGLMQAGKELKGKEELTDNDLVLLFQAYFDGVANRGKAKIGEKTFLDGLAPAVEALKKGFEEGKDLCESSSLAYEAAKQGFEHSNTMIAVHGRAATRGEESRKLLDPGAAVAMFIMEAFRESCRKVN